MRCTTHPVGSAGPLPCNKIQSDTQSTCITDVGASFTGHSGTLELWSDRHYAWITAPGDIMDGEWTYVRVALETSAGAPCSHEGGFHGTLTSDSAVAVCCANHCGRTNVPTDASTVWVEHPGKWSITQHPGEPCTFYEGRVHAGPVKICCGTCWASGVFFGVADEIREIHGAVRLRAGRSSSGDHPSVLCALIRNCLCVVRVRGQSRATLSSSRRPAASTPVLRAVRLALALAAASRPSSASSASARITPSGPTATVRDSPASHRLIACGLAERKRRRLVDQWPDRHPERRVDV